MIKTASLIVLLFSAYGIAAQTIVNGDFSSGTSGWGCNPETNAESVYGGPGSNSVAEVDDLAGLCQTISGFTPGSVYQLSFSVSRRTTCGPVFQTMSATAGPASMIVSRNGTAYGYLTENLVFTASAATQTISFLGLGGIGTCNLIIDNVTISLVSALPVKLSYFSAGYGNSAKVNLEWKTASEIRNDYFTVERSPEGTSWEIVSTTEAKETDSQQENLYFLDDVNPFSGISYYRLSQTDLDNKTEVLAIRSVEIKRTFQVYPNPFQESITIQFSGDNTAELSAKLRDANGKLIRLLTSNEKEVIFYDLKDLDNGCYYLELTGNGEILLQKVIKL